MIHSGVSESAPATTPATPRLPDLLAKSRCVGRPPLALDRHLLDTEQAAKALFRSDGRWGKAWGRFFRLSDDGQRRLLLHLRLAGLFHDIGKANEDFVAMVHGIGSNQTLRHEHISALVLSLPVVRAWLSANDDLDPDIVTAAVLSHHLKAKEEGTWAWCQPRGCTEVRLRLQDPQVIRILDRVAEVAALPGPPVLPDYPWRDAPPWSDAFRCGMGAARQFRRDLRTNDGRRALLLATKAGLIAADAVASGLVREGRSISAWITEIAHAAPVDATEIDQSVITPRTSSIERRRGGGVRFAFHPFQLGASAAGPRVLLLAACGSGKTLAAWKWAQEQARARPIGRIIFLYPTRGTATEGFRDYVSWAPEHEGALVHGTAAYELAGMQSNPSEGSDGKDFSLSEDEARLFALGLWSRRYFSATVDQFLAFLEHRYDSLCLLPALADSAVIVDEVHSFDRAMFDNLIAFLRHFDVPVLCMTATIAPGRRDELVNAGLRVYPNVEETASLLDLERMEGLPRYRVEPLASEDDAFRRAVAAYREGARVLWVVNVVSRSQALADRLESELGVSVLCYHSRYRLEDRQRVHRATVDAFQSAARAIAVTTQVCEMSLDLDADVLLTEHAPIPALVQRFGRANRHLAHGEDFRAPLHPYPAVNRRPYESNDVGPVTAFLAELGNRDVSQRQLAEALARHAPSPRRADGSARFIEGGYFATPGNFRDTEDFVRSCILDGDLTRVRECLRTGTPTDGFVVGVPRRLSAEGPDWLPHYLGVAPTERYGTERGFRADEGGTST
jgi:CRISPR-associated endonuclease/helicase Cas3